MNGAQTSNQSLQPTAKIIVFISPDQVLAIHSRVLLGDVLARRVPVSVFWRYRVSLQRKKCCQQIIGLEDESLSVTGGRTSSNKTVTKLCLRRDDRGPLS